MKITTYQQAVERALAALGDDLAERGEQPDDVGLEDAADYALQMLEIDDPLGTMPLDGGRVVFVTKATGEVWTAHTWEVSERIGAMTETR